MARIAPFRPDRDILPAAVPAQGALVSARDLRPLGQILIEDGAVEPANLLKALMIRQRQQARLGKFCLPMAGSRKRR
ncbi:hypothetical protein ACFSS8_08285 [Paracoccus kondratievae]